MTIQSLLLLKPGAFRLLLAVLVLVSHMSDIECGRISVMLFFLLSGYWISDLWLRQSRYGMDLYLLNRFLRIWPTYIISIIFASLLQGIPLHAANAMLFGLSSTQVERPLGVEWSLDIEIQFYILLPLLIYSHLSMFKILVTTLIGWLLAYYLGILNVLMYMPAFWLGIMLYKQRSKPIIVKPATSAALFFVVTVLLFIVPATRGLLFKSMPDYINKDIFAMFWGAPLMMYIGHSLREASTGIDRHLGNLSYPLYLIHEPIINFLHSNGLWNKFSVILVVAVLSLIFYIAVDRPLEKWRHRLLKYLTDLRRPSVSLSRDLLT